MNREVDGRNRRVSGYHGGPRGARDLLNLLLKGVAKRERYKSFIGRVGKGYIIEVKFWV